MTVGISYISRQSAGFFDSFTPEWTMESYEVVLTFESVDQIRWCDHSNEGSLLGSALTLYYLFLRI